MTVLLNLAFATAVVIGAVWFVVAWAAILHDAFCAQPLLDGNGRTVTAQAPARPTVVRLNEARARRGDFAFAPVRAPRFAAAA